MFLLSPSGKRVQKMEGGNWIDQHEAQKVVDSAEDELNDLRAELAAPAAGSATAPPPAPAAGRAQAAEASPGPMARAFSSWRRGTTRLLSMR